MTASAEIRTPSTGADRPADPAPRPSPRASANASVWGLVWTLVRTDFKARYHGTPSGFLWALLKPTAMFVVLVAVFSLIFRSEPNYKLNLIIGLFLWNFFAEATTVGMGSLAAKGFLVTKARFPRWILVVTSIANALITLVVFGAVVTVYLDRCGPRPEPGGGPGLRFLHRLPGDDHRWPLARVERTLPEVSGLEPDLGHDDAGRILPGADHLSAGRHPGALPLLSVSLAANSGD